MGIVVIAIVTITVIAAALTNYWDALAAIPDSIAAFLGALSGAGFGLLAILGGAFYNADLNRQRDDRLRNQQARAMAIALRAELVQLIAEAQVRWVATRRLDFTAGEIRPGSVVALDLPPKLVFASNTHRLGDLGTAAASSVVHAHGIAENHRMNVAAALAQTAETDLDASFQAVFLDDLEGLIKFSAEATNALDDILGDHQHHLDPSSVVESMLAKERSASEGAGDSDTQ